MTIQIRNARRGDGKDIILINRRAIHEIACEDYPPETLFAWGPPITDAAAEQAGALMDEKIERARNCVVAEVDGVMAGYGQIDAEENRVRAVYVNPDFKRQGVGSRILLELESIARSLGIRHLELDASLTARTFYEKQGYILVQPVTHTFRSGGCIDCLIMRKELV